VFKKSAINFKSGQNGIFRRRITRAKISQKASLISKVVAGIFCAHATGGKQEVETNALGADGQKFFIQQRQIGATRRKWPLDPS
jgi:hypothetical protein